MLSADVSDVILSTVTDLRAFRVVSGVGRQFLNCELPALAPSPKFIILARCHKHAYGVDLAHGQKKISVAALLARSCCPHIPIPRSLFLLRF